jgi:hypothetical protein
LNDIKYNLNENNIVVKTMIYHIPPFSNNIINGYIEFSKTFNKIILLSRKNLKECAESWAYLQQHNHKGFDSTKQYVWETPDNLDKHYEDILNWNNLLLKISKVLNINISYYEDIFDVNSIDRYRKNLNKSNKLI